MSRLPAIACDIDGVVLRGSLIIGNSENMIKQILNPRSEFPEIVVKMPFTLLTNGGGFVEEKKAEEINKKLHLEEAPILNHTHIIQCHTPLREQHMVD